jgi:hypothetical protein
MLSRKTNKSETSAFLDSIEFPNMRPDLQIPMITYSKYLSRQEIPFTTWLAHIHVTVTKICFGSKGKKFSPTFGVISFKTVFYASIYYANALIPFIHT